MKGNFHKSNNRNGGYQGKYQGNNGGNFNSRKRITTRSFLSSEISKDDSMKKVLFDNGTSMDFHLIKDVIVSRFKSVKGDGFKLVDMENPKVTQTDTAKEMVENQGVNIVENNVENTFGLIEPTLLRSVEEPVQERLHNLYTITKRKLKAINKIYRNSKSKLEIELMKAIVEYDKEKNHIQTNQRDSLMKLFNDEVRHYEARVKELEEIQSATVREFYNIFGTSIIQWIVEDLKQYKFRRAYFRICGRFENLIGNKSQFVTNCIKLLENSNFDPWGEVSFREFFQYLVKVNKKLKVLGTDFDEEVFSDYFFAAMRRVDAGKLFLSDKISHWKYTVMDKSYEGYYTDLEAAFDVHFTNYLQEHPDRFAKVKRSFAETNNVFDRNSKPKLEDRSPANNFKKMCANCGNSKYSTADCECQIICAYCGTKGHGDWRCVHNKDSKFYLVNNNYPKPALSTYPGRISQGKFAKHGSASSNNSSDADGVKVTNETIAKHDPRRSVSFGK